MDIAIYTVTRRAAPDSPRARKVHVSRWHVIASDFVEAIRKVQASTLPQPGDVWSAEREGDVVAMTSRMEDR